MAVPPIVVMGVSGSGKSTVGADLAEALGGTFLDGDDFHPPFNVDKMRENVPLTDVDRAPWLEAVADAIDAQRADGPVVMACSALRRAYRDRIRRTVPDALFLVLWAPHPELDRRMRSRQGHYMKASMLDSQLRTFEKLGSDERGAVVSVTGSPAQVLAHALLAVERLQQEAAGGRSGPR